MGLFKRGGIFYARIKTEGRWIAKTLNTADRVVARERYRELERREAVPSHRAAHETALEVAAAEFVTTRKVKGCAEGTMSMYDQKIRQLLRLLGPDLPLERLDAPKVDKYIATRLNEGASRNTIGKELTALRGLLKTAKRAKKFPVDLAEVMPTEWSNDYEPRRTALTPAQVAALVEYLAAPSAWRDSRGREYERDDETRKSRAAMVAFIVATGARWGEALRARREHVDLARGWVHFKITKTRKSGKGEKYVPITPLTEALLTSALDALPFARWGNVRRDLAQACDALEIPRVTPNDLRRTHSNWLRDAGVDNATIADVLGHMDSRMVDRVYGKLRAEQLTKRVRTVVGEGVH